MGGHSPTEDIALPRQCVRALQSRAPRDGGGVGGFDSSLPGVGLPTKPVDCPGNNSGLGVLPANPLPHTEHTMR